MKDHLIKDLDGLLYELADYRSRLLHHLNDSDLARELDGDTPEVLRQIRSSLSYVEDRISEVKEHIDQRVYCIQVTTTVDTNIKVLAKNEDDAIEWACKTAEKRIRLTLAREHDVYYDSTGEVLGHESQADDYADEEYEYDE
jgi:SMC interacting uncharacterized protein involved in chromosome segregation